MNRFFPLLFLVILLSVTLHAANSFRAGIDIETRQAKWNLTELEVLGTTLRPAGFDADFSMLTLGIRGDASLWNFMTLSAGFAFGTGEAELHNPGQTSGTSDGRGADGWLSIGVDYTFGKSDSTPRQEWSPFGIEANLPLRLSYWDFEKDDIEQVLTDLALRPEVLGTYTFHYERSYMKFGVGVLFDAPLTREVEEKEVGQPTTLFTFEPDQPIGIVASFELAWGLFAIRARAEFLNEYRASVGFRFVF